MRKLWIVIIIVFCILALGAGGFLVMKGRSAGGRGKPTAVRLEQPVRGVLVEFVSAPGEIEPRSNVEISAKVSARIAALPYDEGATVT